MLDNLLQVKPQISAPSTKISGVALIFSFVKDHRWSQAKARPMFVSPQSMLPCVNLLDICTLE